MLEKFEGEFDAFEKRYDQYTDLSDKIKSDQNTCKRDIKHYRAYMKMLKAKMAP